MQVLQSVHCKSNTKRNCLDGMVALYIKNMTGSKEIIINSMHNRGSFCVKIHWERILKDTLVEKWMGSTMNIGFEIALLS